jgi:hypothetical protein
MGGRIGSSVKLTHRIFARCANFESAHLAIAVVSPYGATGSEKRTTTSVAAVPRYAITPGRAVLLTADSFPAECRIRPSVQLLRRGPPCIHGGLTVGGVPGVLERGWGDVSGHLCNYSGGAVLLTVDSFPALPRGESAQPWRGTSAQRRRGNAHEGSLSTDIGIAAGRRVAADCPRSTTIFQDEVLGHLLLGLIPASSAARLAMARGCWPRRGLSRWTFRLGTARSSPDGESRSLEGPGRRLETPPTAGATRFDD